MIVKPLVLAALAAATVATAVFVVVTVSSKDGGQTQETAQSTRTPAATPTLLPSATARTAPTPRPSATVLPDRKTCAEISGTAYRSDTERAFFLETCAGQVQARGATSPSVSVDSSAACAANVTLSASRSDATYNVSGTTVDQLNASIQANAPKNEGQVAAGLTEYSYGLDGSFCTKPGACSVGALTITEDVKVTLPNLTTVSQLAPDLRQIWDNYANAVSVHEGRHVTILEEGLQEMKRQLLLVEPQPNCDALDHEINKVWLLYSSNMENRQRAFHAADSAGQGGSIVR